MKGKWASAILAVTLIVAAFVALPAPRALAGTCTSQANGDWSSGSTWAAGCTGTNGVPGAGDNVNIVHTVALTGNANIGTGTVTVQSGGVLNLSSFALTAATLTIDNNGEAQQGGSGTSPSGTITTRSYAANSTYTFNGTQAGLSGTHPVYGNLNFSPTPAGAGTFAFNLNVAGNLIINLGSTQEIRFATGTTARTHTISGNLNVQNGILVGSNGSSTAGSAAVTIGGNLTITGGTFRGTNSAGNATFNIAGNISNGGTWQQDDGSSTGVFAVNLNGTTSSQTIGGANPISFENLTLNNSLGCTLSRDVDVTGQLVLTSGDITTGANALTLTEPATTSGAGDVIGNVTRAHAFTAGTAYSFGNPDVSLNFTAAGTQPSSVTINMAKTQPANFGNYAVNRNYTITPTGGSGYSATVRLHYLDAELNGNTEESLALWRWNGSEWLKQNSITRDTTANWVQSADVTDFSPWAISGVNPTAVTLRALTARAPFNPFAAAPALGLALAGGVFVWRRQRG